MKRSLLLAVLVVAGLLAGCAPSNLPPAAALMTTIAPNRTVVAQTVAVPTATGRATQAFTATLAAPTTRPANQATLAATAALPTARPAGAATKAASATAPSSALSPAAATPAVLTTTGPATAAPPAPQATGLATSTPASSQPAGLTTQAPVTQQPTGLTTLASATPQPTGLTTLASATPQPTGPAAGAIAKTTPEGIVTLPTPEQPIPLEAAGTTYTLQDVRVVSPYVVRFWHDPTYNFPAGMDIATISTVGQPQIQIAGASAIGSDTGKDLTGEGRPEVVVETFTGGAHCCFGTIVYQVGLALNKILDKPQSNCAGNFVDLDKNGTAEFVTCDDSFAYAYCAFAVSPLVKVIYEYKAGQSYRPAGPNWAAQYGQDIADHTLLAQKGKPGDMGEWDNTNKCSVLPLVLDYLYSGQSTEAWDALKNYYQGTDLAKFQKEIDDTVSKSPLFVTP